MNIGSIIGIRSIHFLLSILIHFLPWFDLFFSLHMKAINWKTSSDFTLLLDVLRTTEDEIAIVTYKNTPLGWFHIQILKQLFPNGNFVFISRDARIKKILKQSGFRVFQTLQEMDQTLPE